MIRRGFGIVLAALLSVNLKTAREVGLTIPASILLRADDVFE